MTVIASEQAVETRVEVIAPVVPAQPLSKNDQQTLTRNAFRAAERTPEFFDHLQAHYREARRTEVEIVSDVRLHLDDGTVFDSGVAMIRNVSPSGALLSRLKLCKNAYPMCRFKVEIIMRGGAYEGIVIHARPVRIESETGGLGVQFEDIMASV